MRALLAPVAILLAIAMPAGADGCVPTTSVTDDDTIVLATPPLDSPEDCWQTNCGEYVVNDICQTDGSGCLLDAYWYAESNGIAGLQRGDQSWDDTCGGQIRSDSIVGA